MKFNFNSTKDAHLNDEKVSCHRKNGEFEIIASFSESEKDAMTTVATVVERLHTMDGDRMGWLSTLCDKVVNVLEAATSWQKVKLEREKVALELAKLKLKVRD